MRELSISWPRGIEGVRLTELGGVGGGVLELEGDAAG